MIAALRSRAASVLEKGTWLSDHPGDALIHSQQYWDYMNAQGDDLFDILLEGFSLNGTIGKWDVAKTAFKLEGFLNQANRKYSATQKFVSVRMTQDGVSIRHRVAWSHIGVGGCPSKEGDNERAEIAAGQATLDAILEDEDVEMLAFFYHFNAVRVCLLPLANGARSRACKIGNVIIKNVTGIGLDLRVLRVG